MLRSAGRRDRRIRWLVIVAGYVLGGFILGALFLPLIPVVRALGFPRDSSLGISLFVLMPLLIITLGVLQRGLLRNLVGVLLSISAWGVGYYLASLSWGSDPGTAKLNLVIMGEYMVPAYLILALLVYGVFGRRSAEN